MNENQTSDPSDFRLDKARELTDEISPMSDNKRPDGNYAGFGNPATSHPNPNLTSLYIQHTDLKRVTLDEFPSRLHHIPHEQGEDLIRFHRVFHLHPQQLPLIRIHGGIP